MKYKEFMDEVGLAIIRGSDTGKITHEIPQIQKVAEEFELQMQQAKKAGIEANFFLTGKALRNRHKQLAEQVINAFARQAEILKQNRKGTKKSLLIEKD